jgi:hypothetical protein
VVDGPITIGSSTPRPKAHWVEGVPVAGALVGRRSFDRARHDPGFRGGDLTEFAAGLTRWNAMS